jgi:hypothetical protein
LVLVDARVEVNIVGAADVIAADAAESDAPGSF